MTCPHCQTGDGTCCQCHGTGVVAWWKAEKSVSWIWEFEACACAACVRLHAVRVALGWV